MPLPLIRKTIYAITFSTGILFLLFSCPKTLNAYSAIITDPDIIFKSSSVSDFGTSTIPVTNKVLNIVECDTSNEEFVNYTVNGVLLSISPTTGGSVLHLPDSMYSNSQLIEANGGINGADLYFRFNNQNISTGSTLVLYHVMNGVMGLPLMPSPAIAVHVTEYGSVGEYISGNFTGTVLNFNPPNTPYVITCSFRVRRQF